MPQSESKSGQDVPQSLYLARSSRRAAAPARDTSERGTKRERERERENERARERKNVCEREIERAIALPGENFEEGSGASERHQRTARPAV